MNSIGPRLEPFAPAVGFDIFDGVGRTGGGTRRLAAAQIAFGRLVGLRQREHRSERAGNRTQMTADAERIDDNFRL